MHIGFKLLSVLFCCVIVWLIVSAALNKNPLSLFGGTAKISNVNSFISTLSYSYGTYTTLSGTDSNNQSHEGLSISPTSGNTASGTITFSKNTAVLITLSSGSSDSYSGLQVPVYVYAKGGSSIYFNVGSAVTGSTTGKQSVLWAGTGTGNSSLKFLSIPGANTTSNTTNSQVVITDQATNGINIIKSGGVNIQSIPLQSNGKLILQFQPTSGAIFGQLVQIQQGVSSRPFNFLSIDIYSMGMNLMSSNSTVSTYASDSTNPASNVLLPFYPKTSLSTKGSLDPTKYISVNSASPIPYFQVNLNFSLPIDKIVVTSSNTNNSSLNGSTITIFNNGTNNLGAVYTSNPIVDIAGSSTWSSTGNNGYLSNSVLIPGSTVTGSGSWTNLVPEKDVDHFFSVINYSFNALMATPNNYTYSNMPATLTWFPCTAKGTQNISGNCYAESVVYNPIDSCYYLCLNTIVNSKSDGVTCLFKYSPSTNMWSNILIIGANSTVAGTKIDSTGTYWIGCDSMDKSIRVFNLKTLQMVGSFKCTASIYEDNAFFPQHRTQDLCVNDLTFSSNFVNDGMIYVVSNVSYKLYNGNLFALQILPKIGYPPVGTLTMLAEEFIATSGIFDPNDGYVYVATIGDILRYNKSTGTTTELFNSVLSPGLGYDNIVYDSASKNLVIAIYSYGNYGPSYNITCPTYLDTIKGALIRDSHYTNDSLNGACYQNSSNQYYGSAGCDGDGYQVRFMTYNMSTNNYKIIILPVISNFGNLVTHVQPVGNNKFVLINWAQNKFCTVQLDSNVWA